MQTQLELIVVYHSVPVYPQGRRLALLPDVFQQLQFLHKSCLLTGLSATLFLWRLCIRVSK